MERWRGRVAVVTGASSGIGAAVAYQLLDAGVEVVALARRSDKIPESIEAARTGAKSRGRDSTAKAPAQGKLHYLKCDVSKEQDILAAFAWVKENTKGVDILVNCAGIFSESPPCDVETAEWKSVLDINVLGLSVCTREAIQQMRANGVDDGHIVHISSIAGHLPPQRANNTIYAASKHAVRVLTEGLRKELVAAKSKIRVTEVSPGLVKTELANNLKLRTPEEFFDRPYLQPEDIADAILYALGVPPHVQIHEIMVKPVGEFM